MKNSWPEDATARIKELESALKELANACYEDFCSELTEFGEGRCTDDESVEAGDRSAITFGMIRRAQKAVQP